MIFVILCAGSALLGFIMGFLFADRIADQKIAEMRLEAGLDINTGQVIGSDDDELFK